ncbi:MAG: hypothetical protein [Bacteriophage sp.]|nr:MAG: hypothetical protein [Bacteriophage sp.]
MSRQQAFEAIYAKQHDVPAESLVQYRFESKDGYNLPGIASHYRTYCDTLDSIVVELPPSIGVAPIGGDGIQEFIDCNGEYLHGHLVVDAITAAGVKYK